MEIVIVIETRYKSLAFVMYSNQFDNYMRSEQRSVNKFFYTRKKILFILITVKKPSILVNFIIHCIATVFSELGLQNKR